MNSRLGNTFAQASRPSSAIDLLSVQRRSVVAITTGSSSGTGFVALPSGVIATSFRAVTFHADVTISLEDGRRVPGRVIHVDAERDLAFVLPNDPLNLPPLTLRVDPPPHLGEPVTIFVATNGGPPAVALAVISAESRAGDLASLDPEPSLRGGRGGSPVIDTSLRVIGVHNAGRVRGRGGVEEARGVLPVGLLARDLRGLDGPAEGLADRALIYRCPTCTETFSAENDRCPSCGVLLPHAFATPPLAIAAERIVREALSTLGVIANKARTGPRTWRIMHRALGGDGAPSEVNIRIDELGLQVLLRVPVVRVPASNHEHFYRVLLTTNDQTSGVCRLSLSGDNVVLSFSEPVTAFASEHDVSVVFHDLVRLADQYRKVFAELFSAEPVREFV